MGIIRRRKQAQDQYQVSAGDVADDELDAAADQISAAVTAALTEPLKLGADDLEPAMGFGADVFQFAVESDDPQWTGTFLARVADAPSLRRETALLDTLLAGSFPAHEPVLRAVEDGVLLWRDPPGVTLTECMLIEMAQVPAFLAALGQLHARLHAVPTDGLATDGLTDGDGDPGRHLLADRATTDEIRTALAAELDWLDEHQPPASRSVVCHGDLNSAYVYMDPKDTDTAMVVNWTRAQLAGPEHDVAGSMVAFWFSPFYVENVVYRKALSMARDSLIDAYLNAYRGATEQPLDDDELDYWQAFHVCALATDVAHIAYHGPRHAWDPVVNVIRPERTLSDLRERFQELTRS